jgi:outer membrane protein, heavy metal efflux system
MKSVFGDCMFRGFFKRIIFVGALAASYSAGASANSEDADWRRWLNNQIDQHPDVLAAREVMNAAFSFAEGRDQPLYNPELETAYEQKGDFNNYQLGLSQTIDVWGKRGVRKQQGAFSRTAAKQNYQIVKQRQTARALKAILQWQASKQQADLARAQEQQLEPLLGIVKERQQAGDLGAIDAEMTILSLSQKLYATAQAMTAYRQAEAALNEVLPGLTYDKAIIPKQLWDAINAMSKSSGKAKAWLDNHPTVLAARMEWDVLHQEAELAQRETKAEPTIGINTGKDDEEDYVGLTLSIPLNVRNNFSARARAANQIALSAEAKYLSIRRKQEFAITAASETLREYQQRYDYWQALMKGRGKRSESLLEKQWRSGDLSTTEYLLTLQQRTEGLLAGIELQSQFQLARIDWLLQTGQITQALTQLTP